MNSHIGTTGTMYITHKIIRNLYQLLIPDGDVMEF